MAIKHSTLASTTLAAVLLFSPALLRGESQACVPQTGKTPDVARELIDLKGKAFKVQREAEILKSVTSNGRMHWQTHAAHLDTLKNHVNDLGKMLARLEEMKPQASEPQQVAIESAGPHLVAIADQLGGAIRLVNEQRSSVYWSPYRETVAEVSEHATSLYEKLGTILNYEDAKLRLDKLELLPASGS